MLFQVFQFQEVISRHGVQPNPQKLKVLTDMLPPKTKKELQVFLSIIIYLDKVSPSTEDVCESPRKLTTAKAEWTWNAMYQNMFDKAKSIMKEDSCMKFYDETIPAVPEMKCQTIAYSDPLHSPAKA